VDATLAAECLLSGGDDYELLFTAPPSRRAEIEAVGRDISVSLTRIGTAVAGEPVAALRDARGELFSTPYTGFDHFA
jgi:thiamine-monophosphate kinase